MNIIPAVLDLTIQCGDDFAKTFDIEVDGQVLPLSGATVTAQIREEADSSSGLVVAFSVAVNEDNEITLSLTAAQTAAIAVNVGYYDVLVEIAGDKTHYLRGEIVFTNTVTTAA